MTALKHKGVRPASPGYRKLIAWFPLRPIRSEDELKAALAVIKELMTADLDDDEADYFDTLGEFVERYEKERYPIPDASEGAVLRLLMEGQQLTQQQLAKGAGIPQSIISAVLNGVRRLTRGQIEKLSVYFTVDPAVFFPRVESPKS